MFVLRNVCDPRLRIAWVRQIFFAFVHINVVKRVCMRARVGRKMATHEHSNCIFHLFNLRRSCSCNGNTIEQGGREGAVYVLSQLSLLMLTLLVLLLFFSAVRRRRPHVLPDFATAWLPRRCEWTANAEPDNQTAASGVVCCMCAFRPWLDAGGCDVFLCWTAVYVIFAPRVWVYIFAQACMHVRIAFCTCKCLIILW